MTDIVKKLRSPVDEKEDYFISQWPGEEPKTHDAVRFQAADEIKRLREEAEFNYMAGYDAAKDDYRDMLQERENEIERLRAALENIQQARVLQGKEIVDAANEIESLRLALEVAANDLEDWGAYTKAKNARAALEGE